MAHRIFAEACRTFSLRCTVCWGFSLAVVCGLLSGCGVRVFSLSSCGMRAPGCVGFIVCGTRALSLRRTSSIVVVCGLSCPTACRILVPPPGIEPTFPALEGGFFTTGPPGKSLSPFTLICSPQTSRSERLGLTFFFFFNLFIFVCVGSSLLHAGFL